MKLAEFVEKAAEALQTGKACPKPPEGWGMQPINYRRHPNIKGALYTKKGERAVVLGEIKLLTQNLLKKASEWTKLALAGHTVTQVWYRINNGPKWGVVVDGKFHLNPKNPGDCVDK